MCIRYHQAGERHAGETDAKFLQRRAARDGLGYALSKFVELVAHSFALSFLCFVRVILFTFDPTMGCRSTLKSEKNFCFFESSKMEQKPYVFEGGSPYQLTRNCV